MNLDQLVEAFKSQKITGLAKAISYAESQNIEHQNLILELLKKLPSNNKAKRIGVSGTPGVGKSTFIEAYGMHLISNGHKLAVLAIDPSSQISGGSILGDKTRMGELSSHPNAFVRPSPSGTTLGGISAKTRESILLCEAYGFDTIIVETVGVGQSEVSVSSLVDFFILLMQPGAGDELQGVKRGILELADLICVNKADGDLKKLADNAKNELALSMGLFRQRYKGWRTPVLTCSSVNKVGLKEIEQVIDEFWGSFEGEIQQKRDKQLESWFESVVKERFYYLLSNNKKFKDQYGKIAKRLVEKKINLVMAIESMNEAIKVILKDE